MSARSKVERVMPDRPAEPVLSIRDLDVSFETEAGTVQAVRQLNLDLGAGESTAIVGESGAGKSATSLAIMGLLPNRASVRGSIRLHGQELLGCDDATLSSLRGRRMAMVFQDPLSAFTPVYTIGQQIVEAIRIHQSVSPATAAARAIELLELVGIPEPKRRFHAFPHEFSGGMRQRAMIAMAIANDPDVLVADEPTTALDVTIQAQVLEVLKKAQQETHAALLLITHDLGVVAGLAESVSVMYAGRVVEQADVRTLFDTPGMPYTQGLLASVPRPDLGTQQRLVSIPGSPPATVETLPGCAFAPRCPVADEACLERVPALLPTRRPTHRVACVHWRSISDSERRPFDPTPPTIQQAAPSTSQTGDARMRPESADQSVGADAAGADVLLLSDLAKHYPLMRGSVFRRRIGTIKAVDGIDLELRHGETLGLVGESGCGKSTTVQAIMSLEAPSRGRLSILGTDIHRSLRRGIRKSLRRQVQMVFQDPSSSLDPRMPVFELLAEPLAVFGVKGIALERRVTELMQLVGLGADQSYRYPQHLSGGQRQRVGIARALALEPRVLILDEPVSALDVSIRASIVNLLLDLKARLDLSYLFIAHDLSLVRHVADRVAVMYLGQIVEVGDVDCIYERAVHPYTRSLLSAIPIADPVLERQRRRILLHGDLPSPAQPPSGCRFHTRCPKLATLSAEEQRLCRTTSPPLLRVMRPDVVAPTSGQTASSLSEATHQRAPQHASACHFNARFWPDAGMDEIA